MAKRWMAPEEEESGDDGNMDGHEYQPAAATKEKRSKLAPGQSTQVSAVQPIADTINNTQRELQASNQQFVAAIIQQQRYPEPCSTSEPNGITGCLFF